jgi:ribose 5-phosphate isomerase
MIGCQSKELVVGNGLKLGDVDQYPTIDVSIDGADESVFSFFLLKIREIMYIVESTRS